MCNKSINCERGSPCHGGWGTKHNKTVKSTANKNAGSHDPASMIKQGHHTKHSFMLQY